MRLFEFDTDDKILNSLVVATDQLKSDLDKNMVYDWDVETLLKYFRKYGVDLDINDLYNMVKSPPLKNVVKNIQGDKVIFKGQEEAKPPQIGAPEDSKKLVKQMAKKAMK